MPIHDWKKVDAGMFHDFHLEWLSTIKQVLNHRLLPPNYYVIVEQWEKNKDKDGDDDYKPDILALELHTPPPAGEGSIALLEKPKLNPIAVVERDVDHYRKLQRRLVVKRSPDDRLVAVVELVSRGNKSTASAMNKFIKKVGAFLDRNVHVVVIDIQSKTRRDPEGIHGAICDKLYGEEYRQPSGKPFTFASYEVGEGIGMYVQHAAVGEECPVTPLFLEPGSCVHIPLEETYQTTWQREPYGFQRQVEAPDE